MEKFFTYVYRIYKNDIIILITYDDKNIESTFIL